MHKFRFESVLRHRENIERKHIHEMSGLQASQAEEERLLSLTVDQVRELLEHIAKEEKEGIRSNEVSMYRTFLEGARASIVEQEKKIINIQGLIEKKRPQLISASKEKKVLEKFKRKKRERFIRELNKKEQKIMDDIAANRNLESTIYALF